MPLPSLVMIFGGLSINHATARDNGNFLRKKLSEQLIPALERLTRKTLTLDQQKAETESHDELRPSSLRAWTPSANKKKVSGGLAQSLRPRLRRIRFWVNFLKTQRESRVGQNGKQKYPPKGTYVTGMFL